MAKTAKIYKVYMDFKYTYVKIITKICKFERTFDSFTPYLRKGRGFNSSNETIPLAPRNSTPHTHTHPEAFTMLLLQGK